MSSKVAVVTGANKGIGFAIAKGLCEKFNGTVYLTSRDFGRGQNAVNELHKKGLIPVYHRLDITKEKSIADFYDYIEKKHGGIDVLVNNAAIAFKTDSTEPFPIQAKTTIDVNYYGTLKVCQKLFPLLRENGRVVNVSSSAGHLSRIPNKELRNKLSDPTLTVKQLSDLMDSFVSSAENGSNEKDGWGNSAYAVSKVGVSALTRIQQREFNKEKPYRNISVNSVHPGYVNTDMTSHKGVLTIEQGAVAPLFLALLPKDDTLYKGQYLWYDKRVWDWTASSVP